MTPIPTVNEVAFNGGDTSAETTADILARNTALQAQVDAQNTAAATLRTAQQTYLTALHTQEVAAFAAAAGLKQNVPAAG